MTSNFVQLLSHLLETEKKHSDVVMTSSFNVMTSSVGQVLKMLKLKIGSKNRKKNYERVFIRIRKAFWKTPSDVQNLNKGFLFCPSQNKKNLDSKITVLTQEIQTPSRDGRGWHKYFCIFINLNKSQEKSQNFSSIRPIDKTLFKL